MNTMLRKLFVMLGLVVAAGLVAGCAELNPKTEGQLQSALEAKKEAFQKCYEAALTKDRELTGDVDLVLDVNAENGKVTKAKVKKSSIKDDEMKTCVAKAADEIKLPEPPGVPVEGHYTVDFGFTK